MKAAQMAALEHMTGDVYRVGCDLEIELNAANDRIKRLEEELNELRSNEAGLLNSNGELERRIKRLEDIISRAKNKFFRHGSNGTAASGMLDILGEVRKP
jgi:predicted nuclease with TOPRIM domain